MKAITFPIILYSTILSLVLTPSVYAQPYIEINGNDTTHFSYHEQLKDNYSVITLSSAKRTEICEVDSNYYCRKWTYKNDNKDISFTANRTLDSIHISGVENGKKFSHTIYAGTSPWLQFWEYGISYRLRQHHSKLNFLSIDANKPNKAAIFFAKKEEEDIINMGIKKEQTNRVSVTIKGLPSMIFKAKLWFRTVDNTMIKSQMPQGPFVPITTIEIKS